MRVLSKRQSPTTVLLRTPVTQIIQSPRLSSHPDYPVTQIIRLSDYQGKKSVFEKVSHKQSKGARSWRIKRKLRQMINELILLLSYTCMYL